MDCKIDGNITAKKWETESTIVIELEDQITKVSNQYTKVAKIETSENICVVTDHTGEEYEFTNSQFSSEFNFDDAAQLRKGSIIAIHTTEKNSSLITGFSPDYLKKLNKKYFNN